MCQFFSCHPPDKTGRALFQPLSPDTAAAIQGGYWAYHLSHAHSASLVRGSYDSSDYGSPSFSSPTTIRSGEKSVSTYGYSYGYGTDF